MHVTEVVILIFPALLAFAAASDLLTMTISNRLCLITAVAFPVLAIGGGMGLSDFGLHLACGAGMLVICFGLFAAGWIGGGDAKLAAAIALWTGPTQLLAWALGASVFGGILTGLFLAARMMPLPLSMAGAPWVARLHERTNGIPYGIALAAAALLIYPQTDVFANLVG